MPDNGLSVAVALGKDGDVVSILDCEKVIVFGSSGGAFTETGSLEFSFRGAEGLCGIRMRLAELMDRLDPARAKGGAEAAGSPEAGEGAGASGCPEPAGSGGAAARSAFAGRVAAVAARSFPGVTREVLTRNGFALCEIGGFRPEDLARIAEGLGVPEAEGRPPAPAAPRETGEGAGAYFLDMKEALNANPQLTSKKLLLPFFEGTRFTRLDFVFDHFPPWLTGELARRGWAHEVSPVKGGVLVKVFAVPASG
ncbi:MAG: hypothetical protein LBW85_12215 [Deltaproteobacteria bacterium]|jgi:hypothetical protein|nr:hypothetical protein [Deltaproteobacteria bacterium]